MDATDLAVCDIALPPAGTAPEWVQLLPAGRRIEGRDGHWWEMQDPAGLVLAFQRSGVDLPIDFEHRNDKPEAKLKGPVPAAGWIKELKADAGGIWGRVEWTATAREMIGRREYRYLLPSFLFNPKSGQITRLKGAGLVHNPNLHLVALASEQPDQGEATALAAELEAGVLTRLAQLLGLPPEATEAEVFAAIRSNADRLRDVLAQLADPDPAKFVPVAAVQAMLSERNLVIATASECKRWLDSTDCLT